MGGALRQSQVERGRLRGPVDPYDRWARGAAGLIGLLLLFPLLLSFVYAWVFLAFAVQEPDNVADQGGLESAGDLGDALLGLLWGQVFFLAVGAGLALVASLFKFAGSGVWMRQRPVLLTVIVPGTLYLVVMSALLVAHFAA